VQKLQNISRSIDLQILQIVQFSKYKHALETRYKKSIYCKPLNKLNPLTNVANGDISTKK